MRILLLGGSKFMGLDFLIKLLSIQNIEIYVINRGKIHWNGLFYKILNENSNVFHTICDRDDDIQFKLKLKEIKAVISKRSDMSKQNCQYFDYIVDFSCFEKHDAKVLLEELAKKFKYYIFISTDSVYNASEVSLIRTDKFFLSNKVSNYDLINEKLGYMAESKEVRKKLKRNDSYGYNKLKCEIVNYH